MAEARLRVGGRSVWSACARAHLSRLCVSCSAVALTTAAPERLAAKVAHRWRIYESSSERKMLGTGESAYCLSLVSSAAVGAKGASVVSSSAKVICSAS